MTAPEIIQQLVERFDRNRDDYRSDRYNETQLRREFLDPFFDALGWDIHNRSGHADAYKDVIHEDAIKIGAATKAPDYCFRIGGTRKFFLEAKKPAVDIQKDPAPAFQLRRYAWSAKLPLSILTDFEELAVYDCRIRPVQSDKASTARVKLIHYAEYLDRWDEIAAIFSKTAVLQGSFDKYARTEKAKRGTAEVDDAFLAEIESWRDTLAHNIAIRNTALDNRQLNFAVQITIDRLIFLRIAEDRGLERYGELLALINGPDIYPRLQKLFTKADDRYNSGLFHFSREKDRPEGPDELTPSLTIDDKPLKDIIKSVYYPCPYEFSVLPAEILGQVYEQFLGKVITLTAGHHARVEEKPEVKKAGGVYYTPAYIVQYIVENTVGKLVDGKTPAEVAKLKILDPACGSGSFLLGAYQYLLDWHLKYYADHDPASWLKKKNPPIVEVVSDAVGAHGMCPIGGTRSVGSARHPDRSTPLACAAEGSTPVSSSNGRVATPNRGEVDENCHSGAGRNPDSISPNRNSKIENRKSDTPSTPPNPEGVERVIPTEGRAAAAVEGSTAVSSSDNRDPLNPNPYILNPALTVPSSYKLTTTERKRILLNNIFGVDIDSQAVEVTKLSLLLKVLEGQKDLALFAKERALPDLGANIKCGNSLIAPDFYSGRQLALFDDEEKLKINAFDWPAEFPDIFKSKNPGFDAVIGNPPWGALFTNWEQDYFRNHFLTGNGRDIDSYALFIEAAVKRAMKGGLVSFITPDTFLRKSDRLPLRKFLLEKTIINELIETGPVFSTVRDTWCLVFSIEKTPPSSGSVIRHRKINRFVVSTEERLSIFGANSWDSQTNIPQSVWSKSRDLVIAYCASEGEQGVIRKLDGFHKLGEMSDKYIVSRGEEGSKFNLKPCETGSFRMVIPADVSRYFLNDGMPIEPSSLTSTKLEQFYAHPKIWIIRIQKMRWVQRLVSALDPRVNSAGMKTLQMVISCKDDLDELTFLQAILASRLINFWCINYLADDMNKVFLEGLPIPSFSKELVDCTTRMLDLHKSLAAAKTPHSQTALRRQIAATDAQIDALVYDLYALTPAEIALVEHSTTKPESSKEKPE